jgi:hypothetical protein
MTRLLTALLLVAPAVALVTSCGSSDSGTGDSNGGSGEAGQGGTAGSNGGSSTGGVSGTAGSTSGRGGAGTSGDAGAPSTGGTGNTGGVGDGGAPMGGVGADAGDGPGGEGGVGPTPCPTTAPGTGADCHTPRTLCQYGRNRCVCGGAGPTWTCTQTTCPDARPENGTMCTLDDTRICRYEGATCLCQPVAIGTVPQGQWACARCPAAPPTDAARCPTVGTECPYPDDLTCTCTRTGWDCTP